MPETALILLAAGGSNRMGCAKQLLPYRGKPLLRHAAEEALASGCSPVIVVLGAKAEKVSVVLAGLPVEIVVNERWEEGMGTSIQRGLQALENRDVGGAILALADQPLVSAGILARLRALHSESGQPIVAASYSGTFGVPVFFARDSFPLLLALAPVQGCKGVIQQHLASCVLMDCPEAAMDIDTPDDYQAALR